MPDPLFLLELGAIILGLALLSRLAGRFGFSPIPLYLLAGLAFGEGGLVPVVTAEAFVEIGAEIGVILLLLLLGLEYTGRELINGLRTGTVAGVVDLVLNAAPGLAAGFLLGWDPVSGILLAGVTYISSSGIVAKLLADMGWVGNRETPAVLSILVMEDLVMAVYLPVVAVLLLGVGFASAIVTVAAAVAVAAAFLGFSVRFGPALSRVIFSRSDETLLLSILGIALLAAGVAEQLQISAAVGAFLVGLAISGPAADRARTLLTPLRDLFGGVFFAFFGLSLDPAGIPPVLGPALGLAAVGIATKAGTGWFAGTRARVGVRGRLRAGALLTARGEFSIVIAVLGATSGAHPKLAPVTAAYVLTLAVLGPIVARAADHLGASLTARERSPDATMVREEA